MRIFLKTMALNTRVGSILLGSRGLLIIFVVYNFSHLLISFFGEEWRFFLFGILFFGIFPGCALLALVANSISVISQWKISANIVPVVVLLAYFMILYRFPLETAGAKLNDYYSGLPMVVRIVLFLSWLAFGIGLIRKHLTGTPVRYSA